MHRRRFLQGALAAPMMGALGSQVSAQAQTWPSRNITMIVAFPPGGQADLAARPIARVLADPGVLGVRSDAPWKSVADLVADAKKRPEVISPARAIGLRSTPIFSTSHSTMSPGRQ